MYVSLCSCDYRRIDEFDNYEREVKLYSKQATKIRRCRYVSLTPALPVFFFYRELMKEKNSNLDHSKEITLATQSNFMLSVEFYCTHT